MAHHSLKPNHDSLQSRSTAHPLPALSAQNMYKPVSSYNSSNSSQLHCSTIDAVCSGFALLSHADPIRRALRCTRTTYKEGRISGGYSSTLSMYCAVCRAHLAQTRCSVFVTSASQLLQTQGIELKTPLLGLRLRSLCSKRVAYVLLLG